MLLSIFDAIAALPKILGYVKLLTGWINDQVIAAEKRKLAADMAAALAKAKATHDTSGMDEAFDPDKKK